MKNSTAFFILCVLVLIVVASGGGKGGSASPTVSGSNTVTGYIEQTFGLYSFQALAIAKCESDYNASAYNPQSVAGSNAEGVFQILYPGTWNTTSYRYQSPNDYRANIKAAYEIFARDGYSWREWECQP